jgi:hypothetical protein
MAFDIIPWNPLQYQVEIDSIVYSYKNHKQKGHFQSFHYAFEMRRYTIVHDQFENN